MIALYIIGGIILLIIILFRMPIRAELSYIDGKFDIKVKYLWLTLFPVKEKPVKEKKKKTKKNKKEVNEESTEIQEVSQSDVNEETAETIEDEEPTNPKKSKEKKIKNKINKDELNEKIELIKLIIKSSKNGFRRLIKGIYIHDIQIDFFVANEDAYDAAMNYGKVNIAVYNFIALLRVFFTVSIKHINISARFNSSDSVYDGKCKIKLTPHVALITAISIIFNLFVNNYKSKKEKEKLSKMNVAEGNGI